MRRPVVAYVSAKDPNDRRAWSGSHWYASRAIQAHVGDVMAVGPLRPPIHDASRVFAKISRIIARRDYPVYQNRWISRAYAREIMSKLEGDRPPDAILGVAAQAEIADLKTSIPIILFNDGTFRSVYGYYPVRVPFTQRWRREVDSIEYRAFQRAAALVYSSDWAAKSAVEHYGVDPSKVHVVPFGANIDAAPPVEQASTRKHGEILKLLFVGVDWERKGGPIAFETLVRLLERGIDAELTVVGCQPPSSFSHPKVKVIPFLDKRDLRQRTMLTKLYLQANFFILPTQADATPVVFAEAAAHGLPSIAPETGGIGSMVRDGTSGHLLPSSAGGDEYALAIAQIWMDHRRYDFLVRSTRLEYDTQLNWNAWGRSMSHVFSETLGGPFKLDK